MEKALDLTEEAKQKNLLQKGEGIIVNSGLGIEQRPFSDYFLYRPGKEKLWIGNDKNKVLSVLEGWRKKD